MKRLLLVLLLLGLCEFSYAQTFSVTSSSPADGTTSVPLSTTVSITFNQPLNSMLATAEIIDGIVSYEPYDSLSVDTVTFSQDLQTVNFEVTHTAQTDFVWFLFDAISANNAVLDNAYVFHYTTSGNIGPHTVNGTVSMASTANKTISTAAPAFDVNSTRLENLIVEATRTAKLRQQFSSPRPVGNTGSIASVSEATVQQTGDYNKTVAALVRGNFFDENDSQSDVVAAAAVVDENSGAYTINYVRQGTYWPIAIKYASYEDTYPVSIGFYDENGDGLPDSVTVDMDDLTGIDLSLYAFAPFTANGELVRATTLAQNTYTDNALRAMLSFELGFEFQFTPAAASTRATAVPSGTSFYWEYYFYSAAQDTVTLVTMLPVGISSIDTLSIDELDIDIDPVLMKALPDPFIDSDLAVRIAESNGGEVYRNALTENEFLTLELRGGHIYPEYPKDPSPDAPVFWQVIYRGYDMSTFDYDSLAVFIDMDTGELLGTTGTPLEEEPIEAPRELSLDQNYPNPFNPSTVIPFTMPAAGDVNLSVYNMLGQHVATIFEGTLSAGPHRVNWDASALPSGSYFYRIKVGENVLTRKLLLIK